MKKLEELGFKENKDPKKKGTHVEIRKRELGYDKTTSKSPFFRVEIVDYKEKKMYLLEVNFPQSYNYLHKHEKWSSDGGLVFKTTTNSDEEVKKLLVDLRREYNK